MWVLFGWLDLVVASSALESIQLAIMLSLGSHYLSLCVGTETNANFYLKICDRDWI